MSVPTLKKIAGDWLLKRLPSDLIVDLKSRIWLPKITRIGNILDDADNDKLAIVIPEFVKEFPQFAGKSTRTKDEQRIGSHFAGKVFYFVHECMGDSLHYILVGDVETIKELYSQRIDFGTNNRMIEFFHKYGIEIGSGVKPVTANDWDTVN